MIGVVIRTRTDSLELLDVIEAVRTLDPPPRSVTVVDSGSSPAVISRLRGQATDDRTGVPLLLIEIPPSTYQSARAINLGVSKTREPLIAILSQDAWPVCDDYLARLAAPLEGPTVAGSYGRQIPRGACDPLVAKDLARSYGERSRLQQAPDCWFVNTCSMIRREVWSRHPFEEQAGISEDHAWAQAVQREGMQVAYVAEALVRHHHDDRLLRHVWARHRAEGEGLSIVHRSRPGLLRCMGRGLREIGSDARYLAERGRLRGWPRAIARRTVKHAALYWGYRSGGAR